MSLHAKLDVILANQKHLFDSLQFLPLKVDTIMSALSDLQAQVAASTAVETSAVTLIKGLAAALAAAGTDPTALAALTTELNSSAAALGAAVAANTPAAPPAPVV